MDYDEVDRLLLKNAFCIDGTEKNLLAGTRCEFIIVSCDF